MPSSPSSSSSPRTRTRRRTRSATPSRRSARDLPAEMKEPIIRKFSPNDLPILSIALTSPTLTPSELTYLADQTVGREIRSVPGVARVDIAGEQARELTVNLIPDALVQFGISPAQVVQAVQGQNLAAPVGRLDGTRSEQTIRLEGRIEDPESFNRIPVGMGNGGPRRLPRRGRDGRGRRRGGAHARALQRRPGRRRRRRQEQRRVHDDRRRRHHREARRDRGRPARRAPS